MNIKEYFKHDFVSSIVVFLVALPLCLGIALASGAPMQAGLIAGVVGGIVVGSLSGSSLSVAGPAAGLTTIVLSSIEQLGTFESFLLAIFVAGLIQLALGIVKAGAIGHFFPASVIKGMLAAIGLILILKQIPHAVGYDADFEGDESFFQPDGENTFSSILTSLDVFSPGAVIVAIVSIAVVLLWQKFIEDRHLRIGFFPGSLVAVIAGVGLSLMFQAYIPALAIEDKHLVSIPALFDVNGSALMHPDWSQFNNPKIYTVALTIAIVASLETLLSIEACDKMDPLKRITPLNRELRAQGIANATSGLIGGLPLTSVIVRSSANINAGARSKASAITHGIILGASILLIPGVLRLIPLSCLAGILIIIGFKLTPPKLYQEMYKKGITQFLPFIVTVIAIVFTNLLLGVFIGILVSVFFILKTNFQEAVILVTYEQNYLIKLTKNVSFLNKSTIRNKFLSIPSNSSLLIDGTEAHFVDNDIKEAIRDFIETSKSKKIKVELKHLVV